MALQFRLYRALRIGTGSDVDPFRSALTRYITANTGTDEDFEDWRLDPERTSGGAAVARYCLAVALPETHDLCQADPDIRAMSPRLDTPLQLRTWLDGQAGVVTGDTTHALLEGDRVPLGTVQASVTRRQLWQRIGQFHRLTNRIAGRKVAGALDTDALDFICFSLNTTASQLPARVRNRIGAWMQEQGLATAWITSGTTVREVMLYIITNLNIQPVRFARLSF